MKKGDSLEVLIAEDNIMNQELIKFLIQSRGWNCLVVENGIEAIDAFAKGHYDLILMDIQMPKMNGIDATRVIRKQDHSVPIIAITAVNEQDFKEASLEAGMNDFISKPYRKEELFSSIDKCLSLSA